MLCRVSQEEILYLGGRDKKFKALIEKVGQIEYEVDPDIYSALVSSIISQQISGKAALSIERRLRLLLPEITPQSVINAGMEALRQVGISPQKCRYILGAAEAVMSGEINFDALYKMEDNEVITELVKLKGVGVWTAQMLLIFSLNRKNVLSYNDLGIRRGLMQLHGLDALTPDDFKKYEKRYCPYCTAASLYLWRL